VIEQWIISLASHLVINSFQSHSPSCTFSEYRDVALHSLLSELIVWCLPGFSSEDFDQPTSLRELCLRRDKDKRAWIPGLLCSRAFHGMSRLPKESYLHLEVHLNSPVGVKVGQ